MDESVTGDNDPLLANRHHSIQIYVNFGSLFSESEKGWKNKTSLQDKFTHVMTKIRISGGMKSFFRI